MALKFCANLNFLFTENSTGLLNKYQLAKAAGFKGVEGGYPENISIDDVVKIKNETGLEQVLLNIKLGSSQETQFGSTSLPQFENEFKNLFSDTINTAKKLNCKKIHLMAGKVTSQPTDQHLETYIKNLKYAAKILETECITGVIEPINKYAVPGYFLNSYETAINVLNTVNSPNLKLMLDIFHLQHIQGNVTHTLKELMPYIGHIQIAQTPHRHEPNIDGELNYKYILKSIEEAGYNDWIGCEYKPKYDTVKGLNWIQEYGYCL